MKVEKEEEVVVEKQEGGGFVGGREGCFVLVFVYGHWRRAENRQGDLGLTWPTTAHQLPMPRPPPDPAAVLGAPLRAQPRPW